MSKKSRAKDKRLQYTYGITLEERSKRERRQHHKCVVCRIRRNKKGEVKDLHVDHWHALEKVKIKLYRLSNGKWCAYNVEFERYGFYLPENTFRFKSRNKNKAKKYVKKKLKRAANRGLVCWPCNSGLHRWDDLRKLKRAVKYLEHYFKRLKKKQYDFSEWGGK